MIRQTKAKNSAIHLSVDKRHEDFGALAQDYWAEKKREQQLRYSVGRAFMSFDEYQKLAALWEQKGFEIWRKDRERTRAGWRQKTMRNLAEYGDRWQALILDSVKKTTKEHRFATGELLNQARNDPVMFLNLCGMPPLLTLEAIEISEQADRRLNDFHDHVGLKNEVTKLKETLDDIAETFDKIAPFMHWAILDLDRKNRLMGIFSEEREYKSFPIVELPNAATVKGWAALLRDLPNFPGLPSRRRRGGQFKLIDSTIASLYEKCAMQMGQRLQGKRHYEETPNLIHTRLGHRAIDGTIAAVLSATFPDECKGRDLIRKVRRLIKARNLKDSWGFWSS